MEKSASVLSDKESTSSVEQKLCDDAVREARVTTHFYPSLTVMLIVRSNRIKACCRRDRPVLQALKNKKGIQKIMKCNELVVIK